MKKHLLVLIISSTIFFVSCAKKDDYNKNKLYGLSEIQLDNQFGPPLTVYNQTYTMPEEEKLILEMQESTVFRMLGYKDFNVGLNGHGKVIRVYNKKWVVIEK